MAGWSQEYASRSMLHGLHQALRESLREKFQQEADKVITEAIDSTMKEFEVVINEYRNPMQMKDIVEVILKDRRGLSQ
jgi:hypothetical protein